MEKNTLLAILLSVAVLIVFSVWQMSRAPAPQQAQTQPVQAPEHVITPTPTPPVLTGITEPPVQADAGRAFTPAAESPQYEQKVRIETDRLIVELTNIGGDMVSWELKNHRDRDGLVNMILPGDNPARAFSIALGGTDARPISTFFNINQITPHIVEFYQDFTISEWQQFRLEYI